MASHRDWRQLRRERTRTLIELGGLVVKAGLPQALDDDRATLLGGLLHLADLLAGLGDDNPPDLKARWRRRGLRAFDEAAAARKQGNPEEADTPSRPTAAE